MITTSNLSEFLISQCSDCPHFVRASDRSGKKPCEVEASIAGSLIFTEGRILRYPFGTIDVEGDNYTCRKKLCLPDKPFDRVEIAHKYFKNQLSEEFLKELPSVLKEREEKGW